MAPIQLTSTWMSQLFRSVPQFPPIIPTVALELLLADPFAGSRWEEYRLDETILQLQG